MENPASAITEEQKQMLDFPYQYISSRIKNCTDMENPASAITEEQKQQLMATTLQDGMNAWDFVQSKAETDQLWVAAGILSCIGKGYSLNRLTINWEARELRYREKDNRTVLLKKI